MKAPTAWLAFSLLLGVEAPLLGQTVPQARIVAPFRLGVVSTHLGMRSHPTTRRPVIVGM